MMNKTKTANVHLMRFLFMLPLLVVVLLAFRKAAVNNYLPIEKKITDTVPASPRQSKVPNALKEKGIKQITMKRKENKVHIKFDNGTSKVFDLNKPDEKEAFEEEYGELAPPPPPPLPATPRAAGHAATAPALPVPVPAPPVAPTAVPAPAATPVPPTPPAIQQ